MSKYLSFHHSNFLVVHLLLVVHISWISFVLIRMLFQYLFVSSDSFFLVNLLIEERLVLNAVLLGSFISLLIMIKQGHLQLATYIFICLEWLISALSTLEWGVLSPQSILSYALVIFFSGILVGVPTAMIVTVLSCVYLLTFTVFPSLPLVKFVPALTPPSYLTSVYEVCIFMILVCFVSWIYSQQTRQLRQIEEKCLHRIVHNSYLIEVGKYTAEILHDLRNHLSIAKLDIDYLEQQSHRLSSQTPFTELQTSIDAITNLVHTHLHYLHPATDNQYFSPVKETKYALQFMQAKAQHQQIRLVPHISVPTTVCLYGSALQFNQAVCQLVSNAIDACVDTTHTTTNQNQVDVYLSSTSRKLQLVITDRGVGIAPEIRPHIFEWLFTTKPSDQGTGIGLTIVQQVVANFQGTISFQSEVGNGTTFTLTFPVAHQFTQPPS